MCPRKLGLSLQPPGPPKFHTRSRDGVFHAGSIESRAVPALTSLAHGHPVSPRAGLCQARGQETHRPPQPSAFGDHTCKDPGAGQSPSATSANTRFPSPSASTSPRELPEMAQESPFSEDTGILRPDPVRLVLRSFPAAQSLLQPPLGPQHGPLFLGALVLALHTAALPGSPGPP